MGAFSLSVLLRFLYQFLSLQLSFRGVSCSFLSLGLKLQVARILGCQDFSELTGTWMGYIHHETKNWKKESFEYLNFQLYGTEAEASLLADWYVKYQLTPIKTVNREKDRDTIYTGAWNGKTLKVSKGSAVITFRYIFELDGRQYAIGVIEGIRSDRQTWIAMVRP